MGSGVWWSGVWWWRGGGGGGGGGGCWVLASTSDRCIPNIHIQSYGICYYPTLAREFQGFRVWGKFVFRTLELTDTPTNLADQVKVGHALDQSRTVQSLLASTSDRCIPNIHIQSYGICYYPTLAREFQGFRVWGKFVFRTLELTDTPTNLADQVKVGHALDQSRTVQSRRPGRAHQNNQPSWRSSRTDRRLSSQFWDD